MIDLTELPLSQLLRHARYQARLNQFDASVALGCDSATLGRWENGGIPRARFHSSIADFLSLPVDEVVSAIYREREARYGLTRDQWDELVAQGYENPLRAGPRDKAGDRHYAWTLIRFDNRTKGKREKAMSNWLCRCDCGKISVVSMEYMRNGMSKHCTSCRARARTTAASGDTHNRWTLLRFAYVGTEGHKGQFWLCRCSCPDKTEKVVPLRNVLSGKSKSCGCLNREQARALGKMQGPKNAKTHCPQGHVYDAANTYINKRGAKMCRTCSRLRTRARRAKASISASK